ncbi:hypothetical protein [Cupriavidus sp. UME77]|uniref:hypothetical protein n=1 Tax=Cupriavidus sp. UME77 TaxID=1862321 RepID=UPI0015FEF0B7|nr:hypothetical protein [Cupriavidus sp. UME77]MBB1634941.1 hypothetical protein [Cupriavidus sp. UME77]
MKAEYTVFEDAPGYWFVPKADEASAIAEPVRFRRAVFATKIAACRGALEDALGSGATELHLYGMGATIGIKKEVREKGLKPFIYFPSIHTKLA